ncbi:MAG: 30S ribosomal protein S12 methylthiotransferase RimO [Thermodesulfovibrio sp.]|nr:30S ribosomal protein S12 methylthiotransferase RimO [Thermodesulfovibrio sp.]
MSKVHLISLGCPKNQVDSEQLLAKLAARNIHYASDPEEADVIVINTCGFIEAAKKESIDEILKAVRLKAGGRKKLLVYGCLAKRYGEELKKEIPEIDALWGVAEEDAIIEYCSSRIPKTKGRTTLTIRRGSPDRFHDTHYAYLKIAEGCDRGCTYCAIPDIRGRYRSINPDEILSAAEGHIREGMRELIVVAQDITAYGRDLQGYDLSRLLTDLAALPGDFWIRLLYLYPTAVNDRLLETIASQEKICNYIDMPLQHTEKNILKLMGRAGSRTLFEKIIKRIREIIPDVALRSTVIVGFPQESENDFENMLAFAEKIQFDRLGAFTFSREDGTPAALLKGQIPKKIKQSRYNRLMAMQAGISLAKNKALVGKSFRALVDEAEEGIAIARIYSQAPEIDGVVIIKDSTIARGDFISVLIDKASDYDLEGSVLR